MRPVFTVAAMTTLVLALSACELRKDETEEEPAPNEQNDPLDPTPTASPSPIPSQSAPPVASIIRDDAAPETEDVELPVQPVEMTLPFPDGSTLTAAVDWPVVLAGHTDSVGNDQANMRASRARAEAVAAWLVERGVDDDRIEVIAFGEQNPIAPNALPDGSPNEKGRRTNRRVEIRIVPPAGDGLDTEPENAESDQDA